MGYSEKYFFNENSKTDQVCVILWAEKLPLNYYDILDNSGYGFITSPLHSPDNECGKEHIHCVIRDMHGHNLDYNTIHNLIELLNPNSSRALCLRGGHAGLVDYARYFVHMNDDSKQQFDLRSPSTFDEDNIDENGYCKDNGLLSIYAENKCFYDGGGLDFLKLIHITARESAEMRKKEREDCFKVMCKYIYDNNINNFADFACWALNNNFGSALLSYNTTFNNIIRAIDKRSKSTFINPTNNSVTSTFISSDSLRDKINHLCDITIQKVYIDWFISLFPFITNQIITDKKLKRLFLSCFDCFNGCPRQNYQEHFNNWHNQYLIERSE